MAIKYKFAFLLAAALLGGCGSGLKDVSADPKYAGVMGHVYETRNAMLVYQMYTDTLRLAVPGAAGAPALSELPPDLPYKTRMGDIVLGVLPAGSRFQVAHVYSSFNSSNGGSISYDMRMLTPAEYKGRELSDVGLLSYGTSPASFDSKLVREVTLGGGAKGE